MWVSAEASFQEMDGLQFSIHVSKSHVKGKQAAGKSVGGGYSLGWVRFRKNIKGKQEAGKSVRRWLQFRVGAVLGKISRESRRLVKV